MRNQILTLSAAGALALALGFTVWHCTQTPPPGSDPAAEVQREEAWRAREIVDTVKQGKVGHARALADRFYREFPSSPEIQNLERLTGYHPRPYGP